MGLEAALAAPAPAGAKGGAASVLLGGGEAHHTQPASFAAFFPDVGMTHQESQFFPDVSHAVSGHHHSGEGAVADNALGQFQVGSKGKGNQSDIFTSFDKKKKKDEDED